MSSPLPDHATQTIAVLTACLAQALGNKDPDFIPTFQKNLQDMYSQIRDNSYFPSEILQAVKLVNDLLKLKK